MNPLLIKGPVLEFFEDGEWLRIECPGHKTRYLNKKYACELLRQIGLHAVTLKSDIVVREKELVL
jgi:hypothetical protein